MGRRKKSRKHPIAPPGPRRPSGLTFLPQTAGLVCLIVATLCYVAFALSDPTRRVGSYAETQVPLAAGPFAVAFMFLWLAVLSLGVQAILVGRRLARRRAGVLDWMYLALAVLPVLAAAIAASIKAPLAAVLASVGLSSFFTSILTGRLRGRPWAEALLLGLVPLVGPIVETYRGLETGPPSA